MHNVTNKVDLQMETSTCVLSKQTVKLYKEHFQFF